MAHLITTEHRGYEIHYAENQDVWRCHVLNMEGDSLSQLKNKMNRFLAKAAKTGGIPAMTCNFGHSRWQECEIVSVAHDDKVWITTNRQEMWRGALRTVRDRSKVEADRVALDTPEVRAAIAISDDFLNRIRALTEEGKTAFKAVPRIDVATLPREVEDEG